MHEQQSVSLTFKSQLSFSLTFNIFYILYIHAFLYTMCSVWSYVIFSFDLNLLLSVSVVCDISFFVEVIFSFLNYT